MASDQRKSHFIGCGGGGAEGFARWSDCMTSAISVEWGPNDDVALASAAPSGHRLVSSPPRLILAIYAFDRLLMGCRPWGPPEADRKQAPGCISCSIAPGTTVAYGNMPGGFDATLARVAVSDTSWQPVGSDGQRCQGVDEWPTVGGRANERSAADRGARRLQSDHRDPTGFFTQSDDGYVVELLASVCVASGDADLSRD